MRSKSFVLASALIAVIVLAAGGLYAYDHSRPALIAQGVHVAGVDLGGLGAPAARARLESSYVAGLRRPVVVDHGTDQWRLTAREARVTANVDAMVDDALARSDAGNVLQRSYRRLTGGRVEADLQPEVSFSKPAVTRLLTRIAKRVDRDPVDAQLDIGLTSVAHRDSRTGLRVDRAELRREVERALVSPDGDRRFVAHTTKRQPAVTTEKLARQNATVLTVDREQFRLRLFRNLKLTRTWVVAVGQAGLDTPAGVYHIQNKAVDPAWSVPYSAWTGKLAGKVIPGGTPENPIKSRWLGIFDGAGIHGVDPSEYGTLGHAASHGCVRMRIEDVQELYPQVPVGAPIYIA